MASQELTTELQQKILELSSKGGELIKSKNYSAFEKLQSEKWDLIPEPKEKWEESYRIAKLMIIFYIKYNVDFNKAEQWHAKLKWLDKIQNQHPGEEDFMHGKIKFHQGKKDEAYLLFHKAVVKSENHCFGDSDEEYRTFYYNFNNNISK